MSCNKNELPDRKLGDHGHPRILLVEGEKEAILTDEGKVLKLKVLWPENLQMKTWSTAPTNNYDAENPGTIIVGFECEILANAKDFFEVILVLQNLSQQADFPGNPLDEW